MVSQAAFIGHAARDIGEAVFFFGVAVGLISGLLIGTVVYHLRKRHFIRKES